MISLHLDTADIATVIEFADDERVSGFTSNPSVCRKSGITNYAKWAADYAKIAGQKLVSIEVLGDDFETMKRQAMRLSDLGSNVFVKIPITTTTGESCLPLVKELMDKGVQVNITALMTEAQMRAASYACDGWRPVILSVFNGRIADTGRSIHGAHRGNYPTAKRLWASTREVFNIYEAEEAGWDIITVSPELFAKYHAMREKDLTQLSLETVRQFRDDAVKSGYTL